MAAVGVHGCCRRAWLLSACMAAVLVGVMRLLGCPFDGAWCLVCQLCPLAVVCFACRCYLSFVFLGGARCLEPSPCNTPPKVTNYT